MDRTKDVPEVTITGADDQCVAEILSYFDSYRLATVTPVCHEVARHRIEATRPLTAEIADLRAQLDEAMEALGKAQQWFAEYAESHSEKAKIAGDNEREYEARRQKARTNEQRSEYLRAILTKRKQP